MQPNIFKRKVYLSILFLIGTILFGTLGYYSIGNYNMLDALYMTVITITTVGFNEVHPNNDLGKIFTIILILSSGFIVTHFLSVLTQYFTDVNSLQQSRKKRMKKKIDALSNHIIICGYGKSGKQAIRLFQKNKKNFVVIEKDEEIIKNEDNLLYINANANEEGVLQEAGVQRAKYLISAIPNDANNLFIVLSARQLNKNLTIISRISEESSRAKLKLAGANHVVMPDKIAGSHIASIMFHPDLTNFLKTITDSTDNHVNIEEVSTSEMPKEFQNKTIIELDLRRKTGCNLIGYKPSNGSYIINPEGNLILEKNSKLIVLGREEQINALNNLLSR